MCRFNNSSLISSFKKNHKQFFFYYFSNILGQTCRNSLTGSEKKLKVMVKVNIMVNDGILKSSKSN